MVYEKIDGLIYLQTIKQIKYPITTTTELYAFDLQYVTKLYMIAATP